MPKELEPRSPQYFQLNIGGAENAALFTEISGLDSQTEVIESLSAEKNGMGRIRKIAGRAKFSDIELKRGVDPNKSLYEWRQQVVLGKLDAMRKDCTLTLLDYDLTPIATYSIKQAWPSKYTGASFKADGNEVATEGLTLTHEGFERK